MPTEEKSSKKSAGQRRKEEHTKKKNSVKSINLSPPVNSKMDRALASLVEGDVVSALRKARQGISDLLQNTDEALAIKLSVVYGAALLVQQDDDQWNALCSAEEWRDHPKLKPNRQDALRAALRLAVGFDGKKADSTVYRYHRALNPLFLDGVPAKDIPDAIRAAGGIEKMRQSRSIAVVSTPEVTRVLFGVMKTANFKAWISVEPPADNVSNISIARIKPAKK